jgi:hypothetical protein
MACANVADRLSPQGRAMDAQVSLCSLPSTSKGRVAAATACSAAEALPFFDRISKRANDSPDEQAWSSLLMKSVLGKTRQACADMR